MIRKTLFLAAFIIYADTGSAQVSVIAHASVPVDSIKKSELIDFYTGDIKVWRDKSPVKVLDLKPRTRVRKHFYGFLGMSSSRMKSIWLKKMLSGEGDPPEAIESEKEMLKKVAATRGAIGFISGEKVTGAVKTLLFIDTEKK